MKDTTSAICRDGCVARPATRNHFFTGKLLVERDFNDEQRYFREKNRLHLQRLHGAGIVCGLRIRQHPNPSCENRLVLIEPGSAIDCCGHDILVAEEDVFDFSQAPAVQALAGTKGPYTLQFCIAYRECPTEEIPILYDDCGCDDTQCAPNRILESFKIDVVVNPPPLAATMLQPKLKWDATVAIAHAAAIALDETNGRLYVLTNDANAATLYQVSTANLAIEQSQPLSVSAYDVAVAPGGNTVYVAAAGTTDGQLFIFDTSSPSGLSSTFSTVTVSGSGTATFVLSQTADGHLLAVALGVSSGNNLWFWSQGTAAAPVTGAIAANLTRAAIASNGKAAYVGQPKSPNLFQIDLTSATLQATQLALSTVQSVDAVALVASTAADKLAILDGSAAKTMLYLVDPAAPGTTPGQTALGEQTPVGLAITTGGQWALAATSDGTTTYLQAVNLGAIALGSPVPATAPLAIGPSLPAGLGWPLLTSTADRAYLPFTGAGANAGGVAVIEISETDCGDLLRGGDCPACDTPDCLVLATIANYQPGYALVDMPDPAPSGGPSANQAWIDNSTGRVVLPSTRAITEALECLLARTQGGVATQAPPGPTGNSGTSGKWTKIAKFNWKYGELFSNSLATDGLKIVFDQDICFDDITDQTVMLLFPTYNKTTNSAAWSQALATHIGATAPQSGTVLGKSVTLCKEVTLKYDQTSFSQIELPNNATRTPPTTTWQPPATNDVAVRVVVKGDLIRDLNGAGVDANDLPACWASGQPSGDLVEGGTFESWFYYQKS